MAGVKISNLPAIPSSALTDLIAEVQPAVAGVTYKATLQQVYDSFFNTLTDGQVLIGSTGLTAVANTITAGAGIAIVNGAGSITISSSGGGISWNEVIVVGPTSMVAGNGYIANNGALVTLTLPVTAALGTVLSVAGKGAGGWIIAQNAGQSIQIGSVGSTPGAGGSVASANQWDSLNLLCVTADTVWVSIGGPQSAGLVIV